MSMLEGSMRRGWLQIGVSAAVALSFLVAGIVSWMRTESIDADVDAIVENAMPSVQHLVSARTELHRISLDLAEDPAVLPLDSRRAAIKSARANLGVTLDGYETLPFFATEHERFDDVKQSLAELDRDVARTLDAIEHGAPSALLAITHAQRDIEVVDEGLARIIAFDAQQGQRLGLSVAHAHRAAGRTALGLDAIAVCLAAFATALSVRQMRHHVRTLESARDSAALRARMTEERNAELEIFAGRVAHDVLSPLAGANMALELVRSRLGPQNKSADAVERGLRSVARARRIVDGLLEFARAGAKPVEGASASVPEVVTDVVEGARTDAEAAGIDLVAAAIEPFTVTCSPGALTSIVANLVRNAMKHMGDAPVRAITVRASRAGDAVRVEIEDTGPGIAEDKLDKIFEPFTRGGSTAPGIGLGLATVKRLVVAHGGRVGCKSTVGVGSTFWFELGLERAHGVDAA
jgi:signal transduction histidine kinase